MEAIGSLKTAVKQKYYKGLDEYLAMQYKSIFIVLILGWVCALMGCGKGSAVCDSGLKPIVNSNSPVGSNQTLKLPVYGISEGKTYTWTGPNGYESHETEPTITSPTRGKQVYVVTV